MAQIEKFSYDNAIVRNFAYATITFGVVGFLVGLLAALQLIYPALNFGIPETTFGRIRRYTPMLRSLHLLVTVFLLAFITLYKGF